ncbi:MAG: 2,3-diphosphoglycerate synthetase [Actinomycetota bacterium]
MTRAVVLVDGEHYPPVTLDAIRSLEERGHQVVAAVFMGGGEKLAGPLELGTLPVITGATQRESLERAIDSFAPEVVLDLSDDPVVDTKTRFLLASVALARGVPYQGADFRFEPPHRPRVATRPTLAVIGTGKRCGKTAIAGFVARTLAAGGAYVVVVAMGRGGPAEPRVVRGGTEPPSVDELIAAARRGEHAASDVYEDAVLAGVTSVGARRAGAGLAGAPFFDTVAAAVRVADELEPDLILLEGSGSAIPPVAADATILVVPGSAPPEVLTSALGPYRLLLADLVTITMASEPTVSAHALSLLTSSIDELARGVARVKTEFRPTPLGSISGRAVFYATTAPPSVGEAIKAHLEGAHGGHVVGMTHHLADRAALASDLAKAEGTYEMLVTELKAGAVDVAATAARAAGAEVIFADNLPVSLEGDLGSEVLAVAELARKRSEAQRTR